MAGVPHLNELQEAYNSKGFEIVAVSDEKEATVDKFIQDKAIKYGVVLSATKFQELYGRNGRPTSWVLDPEGKVIWKGHPSRLSAEMVAEWVKDLAPTKVDREVAKEVKGAAEAFDKGEYGRAQVEAAKVGTEAADELVKADAKYVEELVQKHVDAYNRKMEAARTAGDLVKLGKLMEDAAARFKGSEQGDKWATEAKELVKSKEYKDTLKAQEALDEIKPKLEDMKASSARKALEKIAKKYPDTKAGKEAAELAKRYE